MNKRSFKNLLNYSSFLIKDISRNAVDITTSVAILGAGRTGSTLLSSYLDSLDGINSYGEVINPKIHPFFSNEVQFPFKKRLALLKIKFLLSDNNGVVKLLFYQLKNLEITLKDLENNFPSMKFIVIYRENLIDSYISLLRAMATQEWQVTSQRLPNDENNFKNHPLYIEKEEFLAYCQRIKSDYMQCNSEGFLRQATVISYNDLISQPEVIFKDQICPFIGVDFTPLKSSLKKQNTKPLRETIQNLDELSAIINSTDGSLKFDRSLGSFC